MTLEGKVALITGGASGLGGASARMALNAGARVVLVDRNAERGAALAAELGERARFVHASVTDPDGVQAAIQTARERAGGLHIVMNCAGIVGARRVVGKEGPVSLEWFTKIVEVNLIGTFNVIRLAAAAMAQNEPSIRRPSRPSTGRSDRRRTRHPRAGSPA
jgi:NAD(P)-dependent dehydrogenase (short-subunit alcohol dehydrogenase family)